MYTNPFEKKKRQFVNLSKRINNLLASKKWENLQVSVRAKLIARLNYFHRLLSNHFTRSAFKKVLAAAVIFIAFPFISRSQAFDPPQENPFGYIPQVSTLVKPVFADIDNDEDFDLFIGDYEGMIQFYENTGTKENPAFSAAQQNPFGLTPAGDIAFLTSADIDADGDIDLFTGEPGGDIRFFKNTGTVTSPAFNTPVINPFGYVSVLEFSIPSFADIDNDGDYDLFVGEYEGNMKYFENTGSPALPHFAAPQLNPFGISPAYAFGASVFADLDFDGDLDLLEGEYYGNTRYFENTGSVTSPAFAWPLTNPFGIVQTDYYSFPALADIDGDGDLDLFIGEESGDIQYFINTDFNVGIADLQPTGSFELYPNPAQGEVFLSLTKNYDPDNVNIQIFDQNGRLISESKANSLLTRIDLTSLPPGSYYVLLRNKGGIKTRKLVIE